MAELAKIALNGTPLLRPLLGCMWCVGSPMMLPAADRKGVLLRCRGQPGCNWANTHYMYAQHRALQRVCAEAQDRVNTSQVQRLLGQYFGLQHRCCQLVVYQGQQGAMAPCPNTPLTRPSHLPAESLLVGPSARRLAGHHGTSKVCHRRWPLPI